MEDMNHVTAFWGKSTSFLLHAKFKGAVKTIDETPGIQLLNTTSEQYF